MEDSTNSTKNCQRFGVIYLITNMINGKSYVGQTIQKLSKRLYQHRTGNKGYLDRAIQKYGWENFAHIVLEENVPREMLDEREIFWIALLKTKKPNGYNLTDGGGGNSGISDETRARLSARFSGKNNPMYGKHHTKETRAKMSADKKTKGFKPPGTKGTKLSAETKAKMSATKKAKGIKPPSWEGKHHSEETKAKLSAIKKVHWQKRKLLIEEEKSND